jgi:hypothetical protein
MKKIVYIFVLPAFIFYGSNMFSQPDSVQYTSEFVFVDGIYFSFDDFKRNEPSVIAYDFLQKNNALYYSDMLGNTNKLKANKVWGYCSNGVIYVASVNHFYRFDKIGAICLFYGTENTVGQEVGFVVFTVFLTGSYVPNPMEQKSMLLLDFKSGEKLDFNLTNFQLLLQTDKVLYNEFTSIKDNIKKQEQMFLYLIKFNERNPVYFKTY